MGYIIAALIGAVGVPVFFAIFYGIEMHANDLRKRAGKKPKAHHDITDYDITAIYTIHDK